MNLPITVITIFTRLAIVTVVWPIFAVISLALRLLGLIVVPIALALKGRHSNNWPKVFWLWGNDEEGCPKWWLELAEDKWYTKAFPCFWWYAIRNAVNNFRFTFLKEPDTLHEISSGDVERDPGFQWRYRYGGWMDSLRITWGDVHPQDGKDEIYLGFKIGSSIGGVSFTAQARPLYFGVVPLAIFVAYYKLLFWYFFT